MSGWHIGIVNYIYNDRFKYVRSNIINGSRLIFYRVDVDIFSSSLWGCSFCSSVKVNNLWCGVCFARCDWEGSRYMCTKRKALRNLIHGRLGSSCPWQIHFFIKLNLDLWKLTVKSLFTVYAQHHCLGKWSFIQFYGEY